METKVKAAGFAGALASFVVTLLVLQAPVLAGAADVLQAALVSVVTTLGTVATGWLAAHTPRTDEAARDSR